MTSTKLGEQQGIQTRSDGDSTSVPSEHSETYSFQDTLPREAVTRTIPRVLPSLFSDFKAPVPTECGSQERNSGVYATKCYQRDAESLCHIRPWRNKGHKKLCRLAYIFLAYTAMIVLINCIRLADNRIEAGEEDSDVLDAQLLGGPLTLARQRRATNDTEGLHESQGWFQVNTHFILILSRLTHFLFNHPHTDIV